MVSISRYLANEVVFTSKIISESSAEFPSVTFCNLNPFDVTSHSTSGQYLIEVLNLHSILPVITPDNDTLSYVLVNEATDILRAVASSDKNLTSKQLENLGFTIDTMLISCLYDNVRCNSSSFSWFHDSEYGNCYTFNSLTNTNSSIKSSLVTTKTGPTHGLNLEIFTGASGINDYYTIKKGIKVAIHQRGVRPMMKYEGVYISTGSATHIGFNKNKYSKLPHPFNDCIKFSEKMSLKESLYFNYTLRLSKYSQRLCFEICMQYEKIIPKCGCADPEIPFKDEKQNFCHEKMSLKCAMNERNVLDRLDIRNLCNKFCPDECDSLTYIKTVSSAFYPSFYYSNVLKLQPNLLEKFNPVNKFLPHNIKVDQTKSSEELNKNYGKKRGFEKIPTNQEIRESVLMISVYYDDLKYLFVSESPAITIDTLMGVIG